MKENILRLGRLYLFLMLGACFSFFSCNSDDDDEIVIVEKTFLEKYDGTKWVIVDEYQGNTLYIRINNNSSVPFEIWERPVNSKEETCYWHLNSYMDGGMEIIENSDTRFTIANASEEFWWTIEVRGETLKFGGQSVWDDVLPPVWNDPDSRVFEKTTVNVDAFEICPP